MRVNQARQAAGIIGNYAVEQVCEAESPERDLPILYAKVSLSVERVTEIASRLEVAANRVFGPIPDSVGCDECRPVIGGGLGEVHDVLDRLSAQIARAYDAASRFERL